MCFVWNWERTAIISLYNINWLGFITETESVHWAVRTGFLYTILRSAHTVYLCVLCGSQNKQRLFPYMVFITGMESVYCAVRTGSLYVIQANLRLLALPWLKRCSVPWCHSGVPGMTPAHSIWNLLCPKWHWKKVSCQDFGFPLSVSLHQCPALILIFIPLLLGQKGDD